ncbi:hypothetical protein GFL54_24845 [Rhizobium laguerreae]|uniref:DUF6074 family protein n=1 Tax=Rhizobium laguerreae TaxID=1076926 RepID=UPI00143F913A|nr:DUF6074 family protein [Rhizobium laguerreae]NKM87468.1 hypothetical protein [Rhizobium laguerreae]
MSQLDLFRDGERSAEIITFPLCRQSIARILANELSAMSFDQGKRHWQASCRTHRARLHLQGLRNWAIKTEIDQLADAVHEELQRIRFPKQIKRSAVIIPLNRQSASTLVGGGEAGALGQGAKLLAGLGGAHKKQEYDVAREREGGAA